AGPRADAPAGELGQPARRLTRSARSCVRERAQLPVGRSGTVGESSPSIRRYPMAAHRWVYLFRDGNAQQRDLLGGKGANLAEMTNVGLPVPPGFTVTTEACNAYFEDGASLPEGLWE